MLSVSKLALSVNNTSLNPALTGSPRTITVTNTGLYDAKTVTASVSPALPVDASFSSDCGQVLPAGSSCQVTFTPGAVPTAAALDAAPISATLLVTGENTNATTADVRILGYGNVYQGGYVYSLDDSTPQTSSVGGKVLALSAESAGEAWGPDGVISIENSTDGRAATQAIVAQFPDQPSAAKTCASSTIGSYADWYLPVGQEVMISAQSMERTLFQPYPASYSPGDLWTADSRWPGNPPSTTTAVRYSPAARTMYLVIPRNELNKTRCMRDLTG